MDGLVPAKKKWLSAGYAPLTFEEESSLTTRDGNGVLCLAALAEIVTEFADRLVVI
jgi:hypothetical protein